ncbi:MAG: thiamine phosphate synthase [Desulfitobacteriaceae bacterium]
MINDIPWRMMDANLNRVAEGLRVVEDIWRFQRAKGEICAVARSLRHRIRTTFSPYYQELLAARDSNNDPGLTISRNQAVVGKNFTLDLVWANLKRAEEGLRVLEECAHLLAKQELAERELAKETESLRFAVYDLETRIGQEIVELEANSIKENPNGHSGSKRRNLPAGIYALTSEIHSLGRSNIEVAGEILTAGVPFLQYREKGKKIREMYEECQVLRSMTKQHGALFIINDFLDLALAVGADGVHIGQDDLPLSEMRRLAGPNLIIGVSTHSPTQAWAAMSGGADYIGVGPLFATNTKTDVCDPVGLDYLDYVVRNLDIPFVAIGGVKEHNLAEVVKTGARTVALVTEIVGNADIAGKIKRLQRIMETPT